MLLTIVGVVAVLVVLFGAALVATYDGGLLEDARPDQADVDLPAGPVQPEDLRRVRFGMVLRGYRMSEVDDVLVRLEGELTARDARIHELEASEPPVAQEPDVADPVPAERVPVDPVPEEPVPVEPVPVDPVSVDPVEVEPRQSEAPAAEPVVATPSVAATGAVAEDPDEVLAPIAAGPPDEPAAEPPADEVAVPEPVVPQEPAAPAADWGFPPVSSAPVEKADDVVHEAPPAPHVQPLGPPGVGAATSE